MPRVAPGTAGHSVFDVGDMEVHQIEEIFELTRVITTDWTQLRAPSNFPHEYEAFLADCDVVMGWSGPLDLINEGSNQMLNVFIAGASGHDRNIHANITPPTPYPFLRGCDFHFYPIRFEGQNYSLDATAWHTLWFHPQNSMGFLDVNFFARDTELWESEAPVSSILAMMAMVWSQRRDGNMPLHTMYGLAKSRDTFTFLELKPSGLWSKYEMRYPLHFQEINETLGYIFREARQLMVRYYGTNGDVSHLAGAQGHFISSPTDHTVATSRRGVCSLQMITRYYNHHGYADTEDFLYDTSSDDEDEDEGEDEYEYGDGDDDLYPAIERGFWE